MDVGVVQWTGIVASDDLRSCWRAARSPEHGTGHG